MAWPYSLYFGSFALNSVFLSWQSCKLAIMASNPYLKQIGVISRYFPCVPRLLGSRRRSVRPPSCAINVHDWLPEVSSFEPNRKKELFLSCCHCKNHS